MAHFQSFPCKLMGTREALVKQLPEVQNISGLQAVMQEIDFISDSEASLPHFDVRKCSDFKTELWV